MFLLSGIVTASRPSLDQRARELGCFDYEHYRYDIISTLTANIKLANGMLEFTSQLEVEVNTYNESFNQHHKELLKCLEGDLGDELKSTENDSLIIKKCFENFFKYALYSTTTWLQKIKSLADERITELRSQADYWGNVYMWQVEVGTDHFAEADDIEEARDIENVRENRNINDEANAHTEGTIIGDLVEVQPVDSIPCRIKIVSQSFKESNDNQVIALRMIGSTQILSSMASIYFQKLLKLLKDYKNQLLRNFDPSSVLLIDSNQTNWVESAKRLYDSYEKHNLTITMDYQKLKEQWNIDVTGFTEKLDREKNRF